FFRHERRWLAICAWFFILAAVGCSSTGNTGQGGASATGGAGGVSATGGEGGTSATGGEGGAPVTCSPGQDLCGGACTDLTKDPANCGKCSNPCAVGEV